MTNKIKTLETKKQVVVLFEKIKEEEKKHPVKHWFSRKLFQLQQLPSDIRLSVVGFFQRGKRGWANSDTWDFDDYLTDVIIAGMTHLRKYVHGHPNNVNNLRTWKRILKTIIDGFKAYKKACNYTKTKTKRAYNKEMKKFNEGMKLFHRYYGAFWD